MATPKYKYSIITSLYNGLDYTREYIESLEKTFSFENAECILIDDGSTDGTKAFLSTLKAPYHVILNEDNSGFAKSNNRAAKEASGEILIFLNNDLILLPNWLEPMEECLLKLYNPGVVGNVQINYQTNRIDHAGMVFNREGYGMHYGMNYPHSWIKPLAIFPAVTAACCMIRKTTFDAVEGFDVNYTNGYEDLDLCMRLSELGYKHCVAGKSTVRHHISASEGRLDNELINRERFLKKWAQTTEPMGKKQWAPSYLMQHWRHPWKLNGNKTIAALKMLLSKR